MRLAALVVVAALVAGGVWTFLLAGSDHPRHADAIVVLAGDSKRIATGVRLFDDHIAPNLLISLFGGVPKGLCARSRVECFHAHPFSTQGEAETTARLAREHGWTSIVIVSSRYHLRRARMLFRRCTNAKLQVVAAHSSVLKFFENVPLEAGKWAYQLTIDRKC